MVQFKTDDIAYQKRFSYSNYDWGNSYWKLGLDSYRGRTLKKLIEYLKDKGYKCREKASRPEVIDAIGRYQRGLMSYEGLSVDELQVFCRDRRLPTKATTASRLIRMLEKADDLAMFPRFLDLPAELGNVIYELHFSGFDSFNGQHAQPPLTRASRQLRSEALPLFYDCATFELSATTNYRPRARGVLHLGPKYISVRSSYFMYMPAANFGRVPKLDLTWADLTAEGGKVEVSIRFKATSELENLNSMDLTLQEALNMGLKSKFRTIENAREMLETVDQPLTLIISGDLFNTTQARLDQSGRDVSIGTLAIKNVRLG